MGSIADTSSIASSERPDSSGSRERQLGMFMDETNLVFEDETREVKIHELDTSSNVLNQNILYYYKIRRSINFGRTREVFLMSTNVLCKCVNTFIPIEISIIRYNIEEGLLGQYHRYVHPSDIPHGFRAQAVRHSATSHELPVGEWVEESTDDFVTVLKEIVDFIGFEFDKCTDTTNCNPFILCVPDQIRQNRRVLKYICEQAKFASDQELSDSNLTRLPSNEMVFTSLATRIAIIDVYEFYTKMLACANVNHKYDRIRENLAKTVSLQE